MRYWSALYGGVPQRTPDIGHIGYTALTAVSCASAADCTAVGSYSDGSFGIAEHWDGSRWAIRRLPARRCPRVNPRSFSR